MPVPVERTSALQLLNSLDAAELKNNRSIDQLTNLLQRAETESTSVRSLRTESPAMINKIKVQTGGIISRLPVETAPAPEYRVFRRETPVFSTRIPASVPDWGNGSKPAYSMGPYTGIDGRPFWYDFYQYEKLIPVYISGVTSPVMLLPLKLTQIQQSVTKFSIGSGSIWMRADLFATGLNSSQYCGLNISSGELNFTVNHVIANNSITIASTEGFNLTIKLNNNFTKKGTGADGIDARDAAINLPESAGINFSSGKFKLQQIGVSKWNLYGDQRNFSRQEAAPVFNALLNRLVFPLTTDTPSFTASACKSAFFNISGSAKVISAGWCLNVGVLDIAKPFAVGNNGALSILCDTGLPYKWKGLRSPFPLKMKFPLIMAEPGKFSGERLYCPF